MKKSYFVSTLAIFSLGVASSNAATFGLEFSPNGGALNLGSTTYTQDHAVGIVALNSVAQPASAASGGLLGGGMTYDDVTNILSFDIGYGSAFGFVDLQGDYTTVHFHGASAVNFPGVNTGAGVVSGLDGFHTPSGTNSGRITGSIVLSAGEETDLFDNEIYINIHSTVETGGEIRGQLIPVTVPEPSSAMLLIPCILLALRRRR